MSICNHGKGKECKRCYPVYDDEIEKRIDMLVKESLGFNESLGNIHFYGGGVKECSEVKVLPPDEAGVSPTPIHHAKKNIGKKIQVRFY